MPSAISGFVLGQAFVALVAAGLAYRANDAQEKVWGHVLTQQVARLGLAYADYERANGPGLLAGTSGGIPVVVTPSQLRIAGVYPASMSTASLYGQGAVAVFVQPGPGRLDWFVFATGGHGMSPARAFGLAQRGGAHFGVVQAGAGGLQITGADDNYGVGAASYLTYIAPSGVAPTVNSLVWHGKAGSTTIVSDFLSRIDTGNPESRRMHQDIDFNGKNLDNANAVNTIAVDASGTVQGREANAGDRVTAANAVVSNGTVSAQGAIAGLAGIVGNTLGAAQTVTAPIFTASQSMSAPDYFQTSDARRKAGIAEIADPWSLLEPVRGVRFTWRDTGAPDDGVIAQDVAVTMPELTRVNPEGDLTVNYDGLKGPLIAAAKSLHTDNLRLAAAIDALRRRRGNAAAGTSRGSGLPR